MAKFAKGVSGNPGGRPKALGDLRELARKHTGEAVQVLVQVMGDASAAPSARVGAASALLDRGWGRAHQSIDTSINAKESIVNAGLIGTCGDLLALYAAGNNKDAQNKRETDDAEREAESSPVLEVTAH